MTKKILKSMMLVSVTVLALGLAFVMGILYRYFGEQIGEELKNEAAFLRYGVEQQGMDYLENTSLKKSRITYIDSDGTVLFDSEADADSMENHAHREEVLEAVSTGSGQAVRMSRTLLEKTIYYAVRLADGTILRVSSTQYSVFALLLELVQPVLCILGLLVLLSGMMSYRLSSKIVEPLNELDLDHPEENDVYAEIGPLLSKMHRQNVMIRQQLKEARQQQEKFALVAGNMKEGLLLIDSSAHILSGNTGAARLFRVSDIPCGSSVYLLNRSEEFRKMITEVLQGGHREVVLAIGEMQVQAVANPVMEAGQTAGAVLLFLNVTEKMERETLRREFSANVSHELKTPLTSISGYAELIRDGFVRQEDVQGFAERIYREAQRLIQLVEDTIRLSRLDEGSTSMELEETDLYDLTKEIFSGLTQKAEEKHVRLYVESGRRKIHTIPSVMGEILYNLCDNAIKYNREGGSVSVWFADSEEGLRIGVRDTGIGIPVEEQNRIFERFYRVDKSHSSEVSGTGLGLSIVKHGMELLNGEIRLESEVDKGTEVILEWKK